MKQDDHPDYLGIILCFSCAVFASIWIGWSLGKSYQAAQDDVKMSYMRTQNAVSESIVQMDLMDGRQAWQGRNVWCCEWE